MSYDSITIPASGYVSLKKNGLSLSNIRMASIITYSRIDPPKPFCVYGNSTVAYVYGEPGTVITELKVRFWYWLNSNRPVIETVDRLIDTTSDKKTYDLGVNADEYMIISIQHVDRFGWEYFITRGASINEAQNKWCVIFKTNPTGKFNFKMSLLKMK